MIAFKVTLVDVGWGEASPDGERITLTHTSSPIWLGQTQQACRNTADRCTALLLRVLFCASASIRARHSVARGAGSLGGWERGGSEPLTFHLAFAGIPYRPYPWSSQ